MDAGDVDGCGEDGVTGSLPGRSVTEKSRTPCDVEGSTCAVFRAELCGAGVSGVSDCAVTLV